MLLETIRLQNGKLQNVFWHNRRSNAARADLFGQQDPWDLKTLISIPKKAKHGLWKCRVVYDKNNHSIEFEPYQAKAIQGVGLVNADHIEYAYKYSDRQAIHALKTQSGADEILMVKNGLITDFSYANAAFFDGKTWFTPSKPMLQGTRRAQLLAKKRIVEMDIRPSDLNRFVGFKPINAMLQFGRTSMLKMEVLGGS